MSDLDPMMLSVREMRMVTERILLQTALPQGYVPWVRDAAIYSAALGLGGFRALATAFPDLRTARAHALRILDERPRALLVDAGGQHVWCMAAPLLDLAADLALTQGSGSVSVRDLAAPEELPVLQALAARHAVRATVSTSGDEVCILAQPGAGHAGDPLLARLHRHGLSVDAALWWKLYALSAGALTPDSIQSRRHAGPVIVEADGRVIGRKDTDDDTDLSLLGLGEGAVKPEGVGGNP